MADYYNFQQVAQKFGIAEATLTEMQQKGVLDTTVKGGRSFLSSQQVYRLRVAVREALDDNLDLQDALARVEKRWLSQALALREHNELKSTRSS